MSLSLSQGWSTWCAERGLVGPMASLLRALERIIHTKTHAGHVVHEEGSPVCGPLPTWFFKAPLAVGTVA